MYNVLKQFEHCNGGKDRVGTISSLLLSISGVLAIVAAPQATGGLNNETTTHNILQ